MAMGIQWPTTGDVRNDHRWSLGITLGLHGLLGLLFLTGADGLEQGKRQGAGDVEGLVVEYIEVNATDTQPLALAVDPDSAALNTTGVSKHEVSGKGTTSIETTLTDQAALQLDENVLQEEAEITAPVPTERYRESTSFQSLPIDTVSNVASVTNAADMLGDHPEDGLRAAYIAALKAAINKQRGAGQGQQPCTITITQSPGGHVASVQAGACALTQSERFALEAAVLMAQPLPYAGYEPVYSSIMELTF